MFLGFPKEGMQPKVWGSCLEWATGKLRQWKGRNTNRKQRRKKMTYNEATEFCSKLLSSVLNTEFVGSLNIEKEMQL